MPRIPRKYAPMVYGVLQAAITTGIATAIALHHWMDIDAAFFERWVFSWGTAWLTMLPFVFICSPIIQKAVLAITDHDEA